MAGGKQQSYSRSDLYVELIAVKLSTDQLLLALRWEPHGVIPMEVYDGGMRRGAGGLQLLIVHQQTQTEGERLPLAVQDI